jgi:hypothetical protein
MVESLIGKPVVFVKCGIENTLIIHDEFPAVVAEWGDDYQDYHEKWKDAIVRKENKLVGVRAKDKMKSNEKSGPTLEEIRKRRPPKVHKYQPKDEDIEGKFSPRKTEREEPKLYYEVKEDNPILY